MTIAEQNGNSVGRVGKSTLIRVAALVLVTAVSGSVTANGRSIRIELAWLKV